MAQDTAKHVRPAMSSISTANLRTRSKVDLQFLARLDFHAPKGGLRVGAERLDESIDRPVLAVKPVVGDQVLMDAFSRQAKLAFTDDELTKRLTLTAAGNRFNN